LEKRRRLAGCLTGIISLILGVHLKIGGRLNYSTSLDLIDGFTGRLRICERFHKTILQEFYQVTFRKKLYTDLESLQLDLDEWLMYYNEQRTHQGKMCCGRTPMATLEDGKQIWKEKSIG
jgi:hypothetical protein